MVAKDTKDTCWFFHLLKVYSLAKKKINKNKTVSHKAQSLCFMDASSFFFSVEKK